MFLMYSLIFLHSVRRHCEEQTEGGGLEIPVADDQEFVPPYYSWDAVRVRREAGESLT
jgi:hypothetical protein